MARNATGIYCMNHISSCGILLVAIWPNLSGSHVTEGCYYFFSIVVQKYISNQC